jgi:hypothetical protein
MRRIDRIKLDFTRNWKLPGKERLSNLLKPSQALKQAINNGIAWLDAEDIAIYTSGDSYIEWAILGNGTYENEINKLIRMSLKKGRECIGYWRQHWPAKHPDVAICWQDGKSARV